MKGISYIGSDLKLNSLPTINQRRITISNKKEYKSFSIIK